MSDINGSAPFTSSTLNEDGSQENQPSSSDKTEPQKGDVENTNPECSDADSASTTEQHKSVKGELTAEADSASKKLKKKKSRRTYPTADEIEAYWVERKQYLERIKKIPELRGRYLKALLIYMLRRFLWSFGFFPVFLSFWVPLVLARFNPVAMVSDALPALERFVNSNPEVQASTTETLFIAWFSIGFIFAVFDLVLTPFKSPYEYEADVHMRAWEDRFEDSND